MAILQLDSDTDNRAEVKRLGLSFDGVATFAVDGDSVWMVEGQGDRLRGTYSHRLASAGISPPPAIRSASTRRSLRYADSVCADRPQCRLALIEPLIEQRRQIAEHSNTPGAALEQLVSKDEWTYPGLQPAGSGWTVRPVHRALWEMTAEERDETGF